LFEKFSNTLEDMNINGMNICPVSSGSEMVVQVAALSRSLEKVADSVQCASETLLTLEIKNTSENLSKILSKNFPNIAVVNEQKNLIYQHNQHLNVFIEKPTVVPNFADQKCSPYFLYNSKQVIWNTNGNIENEELSGYNINEFSAINSAEKLNKTIQLSRDSAEWLANLDTKLDQVFNYKITADLL
jgi:hypothetical protein